MLDDSSIEDPFESILCHNSSHITFLKSHLYNLPSAYVTLDLTSLSAVYFSVVGLDLLNSLDSVETEKVIGELNIHV